MTAFAGGFEQALADAIAVVHALFVAFIVGGEILILIGAACSWRWIRGRRFRLAHLLAMLFVAAEAAVGVLCPLTVWEDDLRVQAGETASDRSFVAQLAHALLFYDAPEWVFRVLHVLFALLVVATWLAVPPRRRVARD